MVEALTQLTEAVAESRALSDESKQESIEAIAELLKQAQAKPGARSKITVKALLDLLPTILKAAPDLVTMAKNYWPIQKPTYESRISLTPTGLLLEGDFTSMRFSFAILGHNVMATYRQLSAFCSRL